MAAGSTLDARMIRTIFLTPSETRRKNCEAELDAEWFWDRYGNHPWASLGIRRDGSTDDPPERLEELGAWLVERLPKLKAVLNPRLERIMGELDLENSALGVSGDGLSA